MVNKEWQYNINKAVMQGFTETGAAEAKEEKEGIDNVWGLNREGMIKISTVWAGVIGPGEQKT